MAWRPVEVLLLARCIQASSTLVLLVQEERREPPGYEIQQVRQGQILVATRKRWEMDSYAKSQAAVVESALRLLLGRRLLSRGSIQCPHGDGRALGHPCELMISICKLRRKNQSRLRK